MSKEITGNDATILSALITHWAHVTLADAYKILLNLEKLSIEEALDTASKYHNKYVTIYSTKKKLGR